MNNRSDIDKIKALVKILEIELSNGSKDTTVVGGMDKFLSRTPKSLIWILDADPLHGTVYTALTLSDRSKWNRFVQSKLTRILNSKSKLINHKKSISLDSDLSELGFIHRSFIGKFRKLNKNTVKDLLWNFPERYIDYTNVINIKDLLENPNLINSLVTIIGKITFSSRTFIGKHPGTKITIKDSSGILDAVFFRQPYLSKKFKVNSSIALSSKVDGFIGKKPQMVNPEYQEITKEKTNFSSIGKLMPVYSSTDGLAQRSIRTSIAKTMEKSFQLIDDFISPSIIEKNNLISLSESIKNTHYPETFLEAENARKRLAFNELFLYQLAAIQKKNIRDKNLGVKINEAPFLIKKFCAGLDFNLTNGQQNVLNDLAKEMSSNSPIARLLQGEVGSGKTIVALSTLIASAQSKHQGVLLAPTEVLAEQHYINICKQLETEPYIFSSNRFVEVSTSKDLKTPIVVGLLTGSFSEKIKKEIRQLIKRGVINLIIGTHTLLQETVEFNRLGMVVVDEQHRFGVEQRNLLSKRQPIPHLLAMSATPIPRTLALTIYGDLDLSTIKELPKGRKPITTKLFENNEMEKVLSFVKNEVTKGNQAFIVCPFIEPSDKAEIMSAIDQYEVLSKGVLSDLKLGLLHGGMQIKEKQKIMNDLREKKIDVLVSTPVIEVGVDIPSATVIVILSAERFGMAQLHQLRGRVGRGKNESFCFLVSSIHNPISDKRFKAVINNSDGFRLAEEDLIQRGPGDYLGTRQSGWDELKIATVNDRNLLQLARREAIELIEKDPNLMNENNLKLQKILNKITKNNFTEFF